MMRTEGQLSSVFLYGVIDLKHLSHSTSELRNRVCKHTGILLNSALTVVYLYKAQYHCIKKYGEHSCLIQHSLGSTFSFPEVKPISM